jgi:hypothetical protein
LPFLETLAKTDAPPKTQRFVCMANPFGMIADAFFPTETGPEAKLPANLTPFEALRGKFTVFSNLDHGLNGGHGATHTFLSGVRTAEATSMPNGNISVDQYLGEKTAGLSRFPVLNTSAGSNNGGSCELSWTRSGVLVPSMQKVSQVFRHLFVERTAEQANAQSQQFDRQGSILDAVRSQAKSMNQRLSTRDQDKLDRYLTAVREVEISIQQEQAWVHRPRPKVDFKEPKDGPITKQLPIMLDLILLALETDSTRVATIEVPGAFDAAGIGLKGSYHGFSHHGKDPGIMDGQRKIEGYQMKQLAVFVQKLEERDLLSTTQVLFGSGMGDGSAHTNLNLPVLLAGGTHRHTTHSIMPEKKSKRVPLSDLFLAITQQFGVESDSFGHSKASLTDFS